MNAEASLRERKSNQFPDHNDDKQSMSLVFRCIQLDMWDKNKKTVIDEKFYIKKPGNDSSKKFVSHQKDYISSHAKLHIEIGSNGILLLCNRQKFNPKYIKQTVRTIYLYFIPAE